MLDFQFRYSISFSPDDLSAMRTCFMSHWLVLVLVFVSRELVLVSVLVVALLVVVLALVLNELVLPWSWS